VRYNFKIKNYKKWKCWRHSSNGGGLLKHVQDPEFKPQNRRGREKKKKN
jgi:hypothetical protein